MTTEEHTSAGIVLSGLDASNPLAFLAALGTLRTLSLAWPDRNVRMAWRQDAGAWRPVVKASVASVAGEIIDTLHSHLATMKGHCALSLGDDLKVSNHFFRQHARKAVVGAHSGSAASRTTAAFAASFACDALANNQGTVQDTALRTMSGAGHQHFLKTMRLIVEQTTAQHLQETLFELWKYDDPLTNLTLRWDPGDDSRYALQWRDPSGDPDRRCRCIHYSKERTTGKNPQAIRGLRSITRGRSASSAMSGRSSVVSSIPCPR